MNHDGTPQLDPKIAKMMRIAKRLEEIEDARECSWMLLWLYIKRNPKDNCREEGCLLEVLAKGYCQKHYQTIWRLKIPCVA
jgi:hypothetical protein